MNLERTITAKDGRVGYKFAHHATQGNDRQEPIPLVPTANLSVGTAGASINAAVVLRVERQVFRERHGAETLCGREEGGNVTRISVTLW